MRTIRPFVCVLLVVATAIGTAPVPARACACPAKSRTPVIPTAAVASPSCCHAAAAKPACCASGKAGKSCCGEPAKPQPAEPTCSCLKCECEVPGAPPADSTPPAPPTDAGSLELAAAPPAPPVVLPVPAADRTAPASFAFLPPPADLVITLSRLTC